MTGNLTSGALFTIAESLIGLTTVANTQAEAIGKLAANATNTWDELHGSWGGPHPRAINDSVTAFVGTVDATTGHATAISAAIGRLQVMASACAADLARAEGMLREVDTLSTDDPDATMRRHRAARSQIEAVNDVWTRSCNTFSTEVGASLAVLRANAETEIAGLPYSTEQLSGLSYLVDVSVFGETEGFTISFLDQTGQTQTAVASAIDTAFRGPNGQALYTLLETAGEQWGVTRADGETSLIDVEAAGNYGANRAGAMAMGEVAGQPLTPDEVTLLAAQLTALSWLLRADETDAWEQLDDQMEHPPEFVEGMQQRAVDQFTDPAAPYLFTLEHPDAPELPADATPAEVAIHRLMYGPYAPGPVDGPWYSGLPEMAAVARELVVPDPSAVFGDDATWWGASLEVLGVVPFGALAKLATAADAFDALNDLRRATTAVEGGQSVEHAADVVDDMVPSVDLDATDGATIADEADADAIEGVDEGDASAGEAADDDAGDGTNGTDDATEQADAGDAGNPTDADTADPIPTVEDPLGRLEDNEPETGSLLLQRPEMAGRTLMAHPVVDYDFIDDLGRSYDAMGTPQGYQHPQFSLESFGRSIDGHLSKQDSITVINLTGANSEQVDFIVDYVDSLPIESQSRIVFVEE